LIETWKRSKFLFLRILLTRTAHISLENALAAFLETIYAFLTGWAVSASQVVDPRNVWALVSIGSILPVCIVAGIPEPGHDDPACDVESVHSVMKDVDGWVKPDHDGRDSQDQCIPR
jgi:hypothetical protein